MLVMSQNLQRGGIVAADGTAEDRWPGLLAQVRAVGPDVLLLQEVEGWQAHDHRQMLRAHDGLGLIGLRVAGGLTPSRSGMGTAVYYRHGPDLRCVRWETRYARELLHGLGVVVLECGLALPLTVISVHLTPYSAADAAIEAQRVAARAWRYGGLAIVGGDVNHFPDDGVAGPDATQVPPYNRSSRWLPRPEGGWMPNRVVAQRLAAAGLVDVAADMARRTHTPALLAATARGGVRVDQILLTPALAPTVRRYDRMPHAYSDHHAIVAELDLGRVEVAAAQPDWV